MSRWCGAHKLFERQMRLWCAHRSRLVTSFPFLDERSQWLTKPPFFQTFYVPRMQGHHIAAMLNSQLMSNQRKKKFLNDVSIVDVT